MGEHLGVFVGKEGECPYLQGQFRLAIVLAPVNDFDQLIQSPKDPLLRNLTATLIPKGFHQGQLSVAFNACLYCKSCIPLRIAVKNYPFTTFDLKLLETHKTFTSKHKKPLLRQEHYQLYESYLSGRHRGSTDHIADFETFNKIMSCHHGMIETRAANGKLASVLLYDQVENGLSGYSLFYDPGLKGSNLSLGTFAYLQMIQITKDHGMDHLYIGNWVKDGKHLDYKKRYKNLEALTDHGWIPFDPDKITKGPDLLNQIPTRMNKKIITMKVASTL